MLLPMYISWKTVYIEEEERLQDKIILGLILSDLKKI